MTNKKDDQNLERRELQASQLAVIQTKLDYISSEVSEVKNMVQEKYVTIDQFEPVKKIVYGLVSVILLAVVGAVVALVINK